jgi:AGZA family xanthine/uracil permease-like MFS transporter
VSLAKTGVRVAAAGNAGGAAPSAFDASLVARFAATDTWMAGGFALEQGFILSSMLLSATCVCVIERRFATAAAFSGAAAALSAVGLMHSYAFGAGATRMTLAPAWPFVAAYASMAVVFLAARWLTVPSDAEGH